MHFCNSCHLGVFTWFSEAHVQNVRRQPEDTLEVDTCIKWVKLCIVLWGETVWLTPRAAHIWNWNTLPLDNCLQGGSRADFEWVSICAISSNKCLENTPSEHVKSIDRSRLKIPQDRTRRRTYHAEIGGIDSRRLPFPMLHADTGWFHFNPLKIR